MPPKFKFTKKQITETALEIVRTNGTDALTARSLASHLGSSAKPIFSYFESMEELWGDVMASANALYESFLEEDMSKGEYPAYKASGLAYIRFAKEESELFRLLFMRDRRGEAVTENREAIKPILDIVMNNLGVDEDTAYIFHLEMWIYTHGIASMVATGYLDWNFDFISRAMTDAYMGLKARYTEEHK